MNVTINRDVLLQLLQGVSKAVAKRSSLPILQGIKLAVADGTLTAMATDLEISIERSIRAETPEPGATVAPGRLLLDLVTNMPIAETVVLETDRERSALKFKCGRYRGSIKTWDADEFPVLNDATGGQSLGTFRREELAQAVGAVLHAAAGDDSRPVLAGVYLEAETNRLTLVTADGYRLARYYHWHDGEMGDAVRVIVPTRALDVATKCDADQLRLEVYGMDNGGLQISGPDIRIQTVLVAGRYPEYEQIIPSGKPGTTVDVERETLLHAVKVADLFARDGAHIVRLEAGGEFVWVSATSQESGDNRSSVPAQVQGPPVEIAFNAQYLAQALGVVDSERVELRMDSKSQPGVIVPVGNDDHLQVIMPMHLTEG